MLFIKFSNSLKMVLEFFNPKDVLFIRTSLREKEIICLPLFKTLLQQKIFFDIRLIFIVASIFIKFGLI